MRKTTVFRVLLTMEIFSYIYLLGKYPHIVINMFSIRVARSVSFSTACPLANRHHKLGYCLKYAIHPCLEPSIWFLHLTFFGPQFLHLNESKASLLQADQTNEVCYFLFHKIQSYEIYMQIHY